MPSESLTLTLSPIWRLCTLSSAVIMITDDDAAPTVTWQGANFVVGEGIGTALLPVTLSSASGFTVTVVCATGNGSATAGSDYTSTSGTLTFAPRLSSQDHQHPHPNRTRSTNRTKPLT